MGRKKKGDHANQHLTLAQREDMEIKNEDVAVKIEDKVTSIRDIKLQR